MSIPTGSVILCRNIPIDNTYQHTISFETKEEQLAYFKKKNYRELTDFVYIRKDSKIRVGIPLDDLKDVNYMTFVSSSNGRRYYCFITNKEYSNDNTTYLTYEIDVMQTYMFDYYFNPCFVERSHVDRWTEDMKPIFYYTAEDFEIGDEYMVEKAYNITKETYDEFLWFLVIMSPSEAIHKNAALPRNLNDIPSPYYYYLVPHRKAYAGYMFKCNGKRVSNISDFMALMCDSEIGNAVREISLLPYLPFEVSINETTGNITFGKGVTITLEELTAVTSFGEKVIELIFGEDDEVFSAMRINPEKSNFDIIKTLCSFKWNEGLDMPGVVDVANHRLNPNSTYDPRFESKLYMFPYRYSSLNNWRGGHLVIKNEYLPNDVDIKFTKAFAFNSPTRYWVQGYKGDVNGRNNSIVDDNCLQLPIVSDAYFTYMLQNKNQRLANLATSTANGIVGGLAGGATILGSLAGGLIGGGVNLLSGVVNSFAQSADLKNQPDTVINANDCSLAIGDDNVYMTLYRYMIHPEMMNRLADFFHMYGYKINKMIIPDIKSRTRFNYIKTAGCSLESNIECDDILKIKSIFDNGITFWHYNEESFLPLQYGLSNMERKLVTE